MKILITTDWYSPIINGVVTSVRMLQRELEALGHDVRVVTLSQSLRSHQEGNVYYMGSVSANRIYPGARVRVKRIKRMLRELMDWAPDVIHSQCEFSSFRIAYLLSVRLGVPIVHTYHTVYEDYTHYFSPSRRLGKRAVAAFSRWICLRTACIVAPTAKVKGLLEEYGVACRIEVIPTGVDLSAYRGQRDEAHLAALRRQLGIAPDATVLLYLGRLAKEKNLDQLLELLAQARREDTALLVVGDGPYREELLEHARRLELPLTFTGMVPHDTVRDYYQLGDLFITASTSETQGLTYFEALAAGTPVLCRKDPCVEGVIEDGVNGWQYEDGDTFLAHLHRFCGDRDLRQRMGREAALSAERYSAEAFGRSAEALYQSVTASYDAAAHSL